MNNTGKRMGVACIGALLLACGGTGTVQPVPFASADAYYALGRAEHAARRFAQARRAWDQALQVDPGHADARNGMAVLLAEQGDYARAIAQWRGLVEDGKERSGSERAFLLGNLGYALYLQGERDEALAMLEQACVLDPHRPLGWEQLAAVLEASGQTDRALRMMKQARSLRAHDIRTDYVLSGGAAPVVPVVPVAAAQRATPWPAALARTEVRQVGAVVEVHRVAAPAQVQAAGTVPPPAGGRAPPVTKTSAQPGTKTGTRPDSQAGMQQRAPQRLEISNGNGARGMAATWAARLRGPEWQSVRLTNARHFAVRATRVEFRDGTDTAVVARTLAEGLGLPEPRPLAAARAAKTDLRIVLGWDQRQDGAQGGQGRRPEAPQEKAPAQGTRLAP